MLSYSYSKNNGVLVLVEDGSKKIVVSETATPSSVADVVSSDCDLFSAELEVIPEVEYNKMLQREYQKGTDGLLDELEEYHLSLQEVADEINNGEELLDGDDDTPVVKLINAFIAEAIKRHASDIHLEPMCDRLSVRVRVDGVLTEMLNPPKKFANRIVSRLKVLASLDISESRLPQDGRISVKIAGHPIDIRVSVFPTGEGERVVLRILDKQSFDPKIDSLGMPPCVMDSFQHLINLPHGIVLVTGPTGSGKSTTLYAAISSLNDGTRNILTVEDPVEYKINGIGQSQVNSSIGMTFAEGLRSMLRQDPDVVMVGEVRDLETAQIAVQASLTGHTVFSTLHTNTAIGAITRLRDMGIESFLLSSSINGVLAQRLMRRLCDSCKKPYKPEQAVREQLGLKESDVVYKEVGCEKCSHTGYKGRFGVYELIVVDSRLREMIHEDLSEVEMLRHVRRNTLSLHQQASECVKQGLSTISELARVSVDSDV